ncbi:DNA circularization N-terminal domain-containing protein [Xanthobacter autotrophicus]|uniref:DNA circularization N-terminal domain-containing protein n=1 Tax=Xanthobacter TaxID=279 RepID=UPI0024ABC891|nr:DNA circularization N-terminal domain-containing protein [Xanthobacter autotrophicus]MDI4664719.1 DNA circularization N-terminal domain-containing protein [Xanthobacter autotrophicus]
MSIWDSASSLLPGLKPGRFRGIDFHVPDASHEVGRRIVVTIFPGIDEVAFDDLGKHDGPITVRGLIVGDDYVTRALALQAALQTPGTGTLLHPWLGEKTVVVDQPASIHFSATELRVVRFDATFRPASSRVPSFGSTLGTLLSSVSAVLSAVRSFVAAGRRAIAGVGTIAAARGTITAAADLIEGRAAASRGAPDLAAPLAAGRAALEAVVDASGESDDVVAFAAALVALPAPIAALAIGRDVPAIGSYSGETETPSLTARPGATLLLAIAAAAREIEAIGLSAEAARFAVEVAALARAVETAAEIDYESRQDAVAWRDALDDALTQAEADAIALAPDAPGQVAPVLGAITQLRADLASDLHEVIGRLPEVRVFQPVGVVSAWLLAQHFSGDDPAAVVPMLHDIVRRNRLRHPGAVPPDGVEVLI